MSAKAPSPIFSPQGSPHRPSSLPREANTGCGTSTIPNIYRFRRPDRFDRGCYGRELVHIYAFSVGQMWRRKFLRA